MAAWMMLASPRRAVATLLALVLGCCRGVLALQVAHSATSQRKSAETPLELEELFLAGEIRVGSSVKRAHDSGLVKLHVHFHKAGGTLMCKLSQAVGESPPLAAGGNCNWRGHDALRASGDPEKWPTCAERLAIYEEMNWTYAQMEREVHETDMCEGIFYSVLLREPIEMITSTINYECQQNRGENSSVRVGHLHELLSTGVLTGIDAERGLKPQSGWKFMDNMQTRLLSGAIDVPPGQITDAHLEKAKRRLAQFHAVARLEDLADPVQQALFFGKLGWDVTLESHHVNTREHTDQLTKAQKSWLTELNKYDYALYNASAPHVVTP